MDFTLLTGIFSAAWPFSEELVNESPIFFLPEVKHRAEHWSSSDLVLGYISSHNDARHLSQEENALRYLLPALRTYLTEFEPMEFVDQLNFTACESCINYIV